VSTDQTLTARVRLSAAGGLIAQPYSISVSTSDGAVCTQTEPTPEQGFADGRCIGDFTTTQPCANSWPEPVTPPDLATCTAAQTALAGCGVRCGSDDVDTYRVGPLNDAQLFQARLVHDASAGALQLALVRQSPDGTLIVVAADLNTSAEDTVELFTIAPTVAEVFEREFGVRVQGVDGAMGVQHYTVEIDVGDPCPGDVNEPNGTPSLATPLRLEAAQGVAVNETVADSSRCAADVDVYGFGVFAGESITATLSGAPGLRMSIGRAMAGDLEVAATELAVATTTTVDAGPGAEQSVANYTSGVDETLFVTVDGDPTIVSLSYDLNLTVTGP
jgi:hypothetical protein